MPLSVRNLAVARGGLPVLEGLSFDLVAGEALILRGPNGIGKTTLLRTLAGLQPPWAGEIDRAEETIAYAGHADGLKSTLTVAENLRFWAGVFGQIGIDTALEAFDLTNLADRRAGALSAGQKRRAGLARLVVTGRPIWILDEPTVSMDRDAVARFGQVIRGHLGQGGSAILATHIDLGLKAQDLDVAPYRATLPEPDAFDEAFL